MISKGRLQQIAWSGPVILWKWLGGARVDGEAFRRLPHESASPRDNLSYHKNSEQDITISKRDDIPAGNGCQKCQGRDDDSSLRHALEP